MLPATAELVLRGKVVKWTFVPGWIPQYISFKLISLAEISSTVLDLLLNLALGLLLKLKQPLRAIC